MAVSTDQRSKSKTTISLIHSWNVRTEYYTLIQCERCAGKCDDLNITQPRTNNRWTRNFNDIMIALVFIHIICINCHQWWNLSLRWKWNLRACFLLVFLRDVYYDVLAFWFDNNIMDLNLFKTSKALVFLSLSSFSSFLLPAMFDRKKAICEWNEKMIIFFQLEFSFFPSAHIIHSTLIKSGKCNSSNVHQ